MRLRRLPTVMMVIALVMALAAPAFATPLINPETGKNIYAFQKPHTVWSAHVTGPESSMQGEVHFVETACHDGVGMSIVAPGLSEPTGGVLFVETEAGTFEIPIADYQVMVGFAFVLDHWPSPWPVAPVYLDSEQTMPLFVEWDSLFDAGALTPDALYDAFAEGAVSIELYGAGGVVMSGTVR